jgi:putative oxidoreductase
MSEIDLGLLLLRLILAGLLAGHALQKSAGWFGGAGLADTAAVFETWGFRPGRPMVAVAAVSELAGALLIATGTATRLGCAIVVGTMIVAAAPSAAQGLWAHLGGCEVPVTYGLVAACLAVTGAGEISVDHALDVPDGGGLGAPLALAVGVLAALPPLLRRRRALRDVAPTA